VKRVGELIEEMAAAWREQAARVEHVNQAVTAVDQVTQTNAAQTEELSSTAQAVTMQAEQLQALVGRFALAGAKARAAEAEVRGVRLDRIRPVGRSRVAGARAPVPVVTGSRNGGPRPKDDEFEEFRAGGSGR
jgi:predicted HAD superfamily Cof-like phosphohydrolase